VNEEVAVPRRNKRRKNTDRAAPTRKWAKPINFTHGDAICKHIIAPTTVASKA
jgi:hypothetical protein